jgi:rSAM/selenodomain-associated transferase 2
MLNKGSVSVIVPCWNDEATLENLLSQLNLMAKHERESLQLIVVDAAQSASCLEICQRNGSLWLPASPCRGEQLRLGASHAVHSILWFLHADAHLALNCLPAIRDAIHSGASGGYFEFRFFNASCWQSRLLEKLINVRTRFGIPYGDQGLFFQRDIYLSSGKHDATPLFEEVKLVKRVRDQGRFVSLSHGVGVDARRWQRDGWWRRSFRNRLLAVAYCMGVPASRLAAIYSSRK